MEVKEQLPHIWELDGALPPGICDISPDRIIDRIGDLLVRYREPSKLIDYFGILQQNIRQLKSEYPLEFDEIAMLRSSQKLINHLMAHTYCRKRKRRLERAQDLLLHIIKDIIDDRRPSSSSRDQLLKLLMNTSWPSNEKKFQSLVKKILDLILQAEEAEYQVLNEALLREPLAIVALWIRGEKDTFAVLVTEGKKIRIARLEHEYLQQLLTENAYQHPRFRENCFSMIGKYDRRDAVDQLEVFCIRKISPSRWEAKDAHACVVTLSRSDLDSVLSNIPSPIKDGLISEVNQSYGTGEWRYVPPGSNSIAMKDLCYEGADWKFPRKYVNTSHHQCMAKSFCGSLCYIGEPHVANLIRKATEDLALNSFCTILPEEFIKAVDPILQKYLKKRLRKRGRKRHFNPFDRQNNNKSTIFLSKLKGEHNEANHVVAFVGTMMLDSNRGMAVSISKTSLDEACGGYGYKGLHWTYELA